MLFNNHTLVEEIRRQAKAKELSVDEDFWSLLGIWINERMLVELLDLLSGQIDAIVNIDPDLSEKEILGIAARHMVTFLGAQSASVRIYDPNAEKMISYGSYPSEEERRESDVPFRGTIAGQVAESGEPFLSSDLLKEDLYKNKRVVYGRGVSSLMAIPLEIPRFFPRERNAVGVIQIYYAEAGRNFSPVEVKLAVLMAKRLSFVMARKKILYLNRSNEKREAIVRHIFSKLGSRGGIKMKEIFNNVVPELAELVDLQSCALFSVKRDLEGVILESGFPNHDGYHSIGKSFPVNSEPAFELLLNLQDYRGESRYEVVTPLYILVVDPQRSDLISDNLKKMAEQKLINSILYIPLSIDGEITHFMTFDALDQRKRYRDDEISLLLFLGRELMKAQKMERLDDALHDFKNPAIATAGFARRLKRLIKKGDMEGSKEKIDWYSDIILEETSRLQELAMSLYHVGEKQAVDFAEVLKRRFIINREAIKEELRQNIELKEGPFHNGLKVKCHPVQLERVFDNLLNNATKAVPLMGGVISIRTYEHGKWACAEISNTGSISDEDSMKLLEGEGEGRGLYITQRIMRLLNGKIEIRCTENMTIFVVCFPQWKP
jgi:signal transduction histidine kinase